MSPTAKRECLHAIAQIIGEKLARIYRLANHRQSPRATSIATDARRGAQTPVGRSVRTPEHHRAPVTSQMAR